MSVYVCVHVCEYNTTKCASGFYGNLLAAGADGNVGMWLMMCAVRALQRYQQDFWWCLWVLETLHSWLMTLFLCVSVVFMKPFCVFELNYVIVLKGEMLSCVHSSVE
jgi:hypothetical protein